MPAYHRLLALLVVLVPSVASIVHAPTPIRAQALAQTGKRERPALIVTGEAGRDLPTPVADMREAILEAARSGRIEELRVPIELNELKPIIGDGQGGDPIASLRRLSAEDDGRDILRAIEQILEGPWAAVPLGTDIENNRIYVWPSFAAKGLATLTPAEREASRKSFRQRRARR